MEAARRPFHERRAHSARCIVLAAAACCAICLVGLTWTAPVSGSPFALLAQKLSYGVRLRPPHSSLHCPSGQPSSQHVRCLRCCFAKGCAPQAPESFGTESQPRTPPRSVNSMGDSLPPVAAEIEPPGFYKTRGDLDGTLVNTRSGVFYNDHPALVPAGAAASPPEPAEGPGVGDGAPIEVEGTAVSKGAAAAGARLGPTYGVHEGMDKDDGWAAPYGNFKDLQLGDEPDMNSERLNLLQKGIEKFRDRAREREERVQGKVWREHKRVTTLARETHRLNTWLQQLQYRWDHGPYPVHGPPGHEGLRGEAGAAGANGREGRRGSAGHAGAPGLTEVVEEIERRHDGPGMLRQIITRDIPEAEKKSLVYEKLKAMRRRLAALQASNKRLLSKLKSSKPMSVTWQTHVPASQKIRAAGVPAAAASASGVSDARTSSSSEARKAGARGRVLRRAKSKIASTTRKLH